MSFENYYRDSIAEIDLTAIAYNIQQLKEHLKQGTEVCAVVKADAYGHGDVQVARAALKAGAKSLAVALLDEALKLRNAGIKAPILVMGWTRPKDAVVAAEYNIALTVFQKEWLMEAANLSFKETLKFHLKIDTGMGRLGVRSIDEMEEILAVLRKDPKFKLEALFTHFATADEEDRGYFDKQQTRWNEMFSYFKRNWAEDIEVHTSNSATSMQVPERMDHFVRYGISMYGLYPSSYVKKRKPIDLKPAFSLTSRLVHIKKMNAGESISYGAVYKTETEEWIGTIPLGYADGWIRKMQGMDVLIDGKRHPIVGRICMDQFMIRLDQEYPIGTKVTLIGKQGDQEISADDVAEHLDTINYEIPCMISQRVPRVFQEGGRTVEVRNSLL
ncbi:alanine racemase [Halobacillus karajensis]|uniref:Alanine racemase n=1 Tax=Halobacillus karajensis TaxID=195088 RepID=A0A024P9A8_9BACI|nr:alanine racemase [Halobacillus karajensis]CDQ21503.1 Alanine racemase [Halobacillus karajensis]CDQ25438.1 Alanine racemase [Halobacillus karajensis]CDQ29031.1 Alanine racemase [Halobacillus karajensis]SEI09422.1 alanine racemase [Halobacillus karajensis]